MKYLWFRITLYTLLPTLCITQAPDTLWTKTYGGSGNDMGYSVQQTVDGGFIIAGWTRSFGAGGSDIYLIKVDAVGNLVWEKTYGGSEEEMGWSVIQTPDGGYIIAGYTYSFGNGDADVYLIRTDSLGDTLWTNTYGGDSTDSGYSLTTASDGGFVIAGRTQSSGAGSDDIYLIRTDSLGNLVWQKTYGGPLFDIAYSICETYDGGYIIAGYSSSFGNAGAYVIRTDSQGDSLWTRLYGGSMHDLASHVEPINDTSYIISGYTESFGAFYGDFLLVKFNDNGDTIWTRNYGGEFTEWAYPVKQTTDNCYIVAGWTDSYGGTYGSNVYLVKLDEWGDTIWTGVYANDTNEAAFDMQITSDGSYIIVGSTNSYGAGGDDVYLIKTEPDTLSIKKHKIYPVECKNSGATIFSGPLQLPKNKNCRVFDITGRVVMPDKIKPGIYFIEIDGRITGKVIKIR
jgi:hypothetical protein